jgi:adenylate cyclase
MKVHFQQQLNQELLRSEKRRIVIIISIFLFLMAYRLVQGYFFEMDKETQQVQSSSTIVVLFPILVILFEFVSLLYINRQIKSGKNKVPFLKQYLHTAVEICLPSFIILTVARQFPDYDVLKSPALYIYFIFIILSTLRLNFSLSFVCGFLSAMSYFILAFFIYEHFDFNDAARAAIMLLSGIAAGLVAHQIRKGINNSVKETERRHKVESLFGQQISMEVAEKILENNGEIESKRMHVAIMFIDIRNFTNFAAARKPEEIVQFQNAFFTVISNTIAKHGGIVNQFLGDGCMVTFGAPIALQKPSMHAVKAAIEINQKLREEINSGNIPHTVIGIGIHTGDAITGNIGTNIRQQYSVTGKVVIIAARVEQLNKEFNSQILITDAVLNNADPQLIAYAKDLGKINLKGFEEAFTIHKVA